MPASSLDDVLVINPSRLRPSSAEEVRRAESELGVQLPTGYAEYVQRLGDGALGHLVGVVSAQRLPEHTLEWRQRVSEYWFWDTTDAGVTQESLQERGVVVAGSFDGDELCFDPAQPETLFVLPRDEDVAVRVGPGFLAAVDWMLSGALNGWVEGWTFEVPTHRAEVRRELPSVPLLAEAIGAVSELREHSHVVDLATRTTFFLPAIEGRLSLYQPEDENVSMDLSYDESADPAAVARILAPLGAG